MSNVPALPPDSVVIARYSKMAGIPPDLFVHLAIHAMAAHIGVHGRITVPFYYVHNCTTCPVAAANKHNIVSGNFG